MAWDNVQQSTWCIEGNDEKDYHCDDDDDADDNDDDDDLHHINHDNVTCSLSVKATMAGVTHSPVSVVTISGRPSWVKTPENHFTKKITKTNRYFLSSE